MSLNMTLLVCAVLLLLAVTIWPESEECVAGQFIKELDDGSLLVSEELQLCTTGEWELKVPDTKPPLPPGGSEVRLWH